MNKNETIHSKGKRQISYSIFNKKFVMLKEDCRHFKGNVPCLPHKKFGVHCKSCTYYESVNSRILIVKLGAMGDVIRTTPLLRKLWSIYPKSEIWWLTKSPEVLPHKVDCALPFNLESIMIIQTLPFDIVYNLDKDKEACALMNVIQSKEKKGFYLRNGKTKPIDSDAEHKFITGIFDDISKANKKSYQEEIFEICGFKFCGEEYVFDEIVNETYWNIDKSRKVVGLNTGCGGRWISRLWKDSFWIELAHLLKENHYEVVLLGGKQEDKKNLEISKASGASYFGHFPLKKFFELVNQCDLVVTVVTMTMHIAIGLKKRILLLNNIFNPFEFELYGRGEIIQPEIECKCFYQPECTNHIHCMETIKPDKVFSAIMTLMHQMEI